MNNSYHFLRPVAVKNTIRFQIENKTSNFDAMSRIRPENFGYNVYLCNQVAQVWVDVH